MSIEYNDEEETKNEDVVIEEKPENKNDEEDGKILAIGTAIAQSVEVRKSIDEIETNKIVKLIKSMKVHASSVSEESARDVLVESLVFALAESIKLETELSRVEETLEKVLGTENGELIGALMNVHPDSGMVRAAPGIFIRSKMMNARASLLQPTNQNPPVVYELPTAQQQQQQQIIEQDLIELASKSSNTSCPTVFSCFNNESDSSSCDSSCGSRDDSSITGNRRRRRKSHNNNNHRNKNTSRSRNNNRSSTSRKRRGCTNSSNSNNNNNNNSHNWTTRRHHGHHHHGHHHHRSSKHHHRKGKHHSRHHHHYHYHHKNKKKHSTSTWDSFKKLFSGFSLKKKFSKKKSDEKNLCSIQGILKTSRTTSTAKNCSRSNKKCVRFSQCIVFDGSGTMIGSQPIEMTSQNIQQQEHNVEQPNESVVLA